MCTFDHMFLEIPKLLGAAFLANRETVARYDWCNRSAASLLVNSARWNNFLILIPSIYSPFFIFVMLGRPIQTSHWRSPEVPPFAILSLQRYIEMILYLYLSQNTKWTNCSLFHIIKFRGAAKWILKQFEGKRTGNCFKLSYSFADVTLTQIHIVLL